MFVWATLKRIHCHFETVPVHRPFEIEIDICAGRMFKYCFPTLPIQTMLNRNFEKKRHNPSYSGALPSTSSLYIHFCFSTFCRSVRVSKGLCIIWFVSSSNRKGLLDISERTFSCKNEKGPFVKLSYMYCYNLTHSILQGQIWPPIYFIQLINDFLCFKLFKCCFDCSCYLLIDCSLISLCRTKCKFYIPITLRS